MPRYRLYAPRPDPLPDEPEAAPEAADDTTVPPLPSRDDAEMLQLLEGAEVVACEQIPQGSNYSFVVGLSASGTDVDLLAIYKPRRGEAPLWDFPDGTLYKREYATYLACMAFGWPFVPPTVVREGPYGVGSVQQYVKPEAKQRYYDWRKDKVPDLMRLAAFDYITNNADRKAGHCLLDEQGAVWAIDHGLTFHAETKLRTVIREFSGLPLPGWLVTELCGFVDQGRVARLDADLRPLLSRAELDAFQRRLQRLLSRRRFPQLESYDSMPREWW